MAYKLKQSGDYRKRRNYSMIKNSLELDDLLQIQKESYQWFVTEGVKEVLEDFSPVESFSGSLSGMGKQTLSQDHLLLKFRAQLRQTH